MTIPFIDVPVFQAILMIGLAASTTYYFVMLYGTYDFFRRPRNEAPRGAEPPVTILKPLRGADRYLYDNLVSLCRQQYGKFQVLCGVADPDDSAIPVVRRLQDEYPEIDIELVVNPRVYGTNYKVSNLLNMYRRAKHDVLVIADSDVRVGPGYLRRIVTRVLEPRTGLVTCLYRAMNTGGMPSLLESMFVNTDFCGMVLVARKVERPSYAFGATIAMRREVLERVGGFLALANYLADDYQLGNRVGALGLDLVLSDEVVETMVAVDGWRTLFQHQLRWARTYRACRPTGYFSSVITHGTMWALANLLYQGFSAGSCLVAAGLLTLRYGCAAMLCWPYLRSNTRPHQLAVLWCKDILVSLMWFLAFAGDTVWWSGRQFRILRNGEMTDLTPGAPEVESSQPHRIPAIPEQEM